MPLTFGGNYPQLTRVRTGCFSLDLAVGGDTVYRGGAELGFPMRTLVYVFSRHTGIGKSMFVFSLAARMSKEFDKHPNIAIMPIDTFARPVAERILETNGAQGYVEFIHELRHEVGIDRLEHLLRDERFCCAVFDGVAAYEPSAVREASSVQDAAMGKAHQEISRFVSQLNGIVKSASVDKIAFLTTSLKLNMGGFGAMGYHPKGGDAPKERSAIHIDLNWTYNPALVAFPNGRLITGEVQKNNFGPVDKAFRVWMNGSGIHLGMTAAYDCVMFGLATGGKTFTDSFSMDGVKLGSPKKLGELDEHAAAFVPFYEALAKHEEELCSVVITKKAMKAKLEKETADKKGKKKDLDNVEVKVDMSTGEIVDIEDGFEPEE